MKYRFCRLCGQKATLAEAGYDSEQECFVEKFVCPQGHEEECTYKEDVEPFGNGDGPGDPGPHVERLNRILDELEGKRSGRKLRRVR